MTTQKNKGALLLAGLITSIMLLLTSCGTGPSNQPATANNSAASPTPAMSPTPTPAACDDNAMNALVKAAIMRVPGLKPRRVNYFSKSCVVTLQGYVHAQAMYVKLIEEVQKIDGVKGIDVYRLKVKPDPVTVTQVCEDVCDLRTQKPCGDICIPKDDPCNIEGTVCEIQTKTDSPKASPSGP